MVYFLDEIDVRIHSSETESGRESRPKDDHDQLNDIGRPRLGRLSIREAAVIGGNRFRNAPKVGGEAL